MNWPTSILPVHPRSKTAYQMPVQINEMVIRANIKEPAAQSQPDPKTGGGTDVNKEELIRECAALVMEMINQQNQR